MTSQAFISALLFLNSLIHEHPLDQKYPTLDGEYSSVTTPEHVHKNPIYDEKITKNIQDKIASGSFLRWYDQIDIQVINGKVILKGFVKTWDDKYQVGREIREIEGVRSVDNQLKVKDTPETDYRYDDQKNWVTDQDLIQKIRDKLDIRGTTKEGLGQIEVLVDDGHVILEGTVNNWSDKNYIESEVRRLGQVKSLTSKIKVRGSVYEKDFRKSLSFDQRLAKEIEDKFLSKYDQITVQVINGKVLLQGIVKTWSDKDRLENQIRHYGGVRNLESQLRVKEEMQVENRFRQYAQDMHATPEDGLLNQGIRNQATTKRLWEKYKDVTLNTTNGVVTLEGSVDARNDEQYLMREINRSPGVKSVTSRLQIRLE